MTIFRVRETYQDLKRYGRIVSVLIRYGFGDLIHKLKLKYHLPLQRKILKRELRGLKYFSTAERIRMAFEELGPTFIKFGQLLSCRPDLFPPDFIQELSKLQDKVPTLPFDKIKDFIESQLGKPIALLFQYIEEEPIASASLAQVYRAKTITGDEVAVKVQRPLIREVIETDIRILQNLAFLAEKHIPESRYYEPVKIVNEIAKNIRRELDFIREGRNIERFRKYFANDKTVCFPKVFWDLTTSKILTTEYIRGIKISHIEELKTKGLDCKTIAINGANLILKEIFEAQFFHADPHPGNLFVLENNVIAPVDFGMIGMLDEEITHQLSVLLTAVVKKDLDTIVDTLLKIGIAHDRLDRNAFKLDIWDFLERYHGVPLKQIKYTDIINELIGIMHEYRLRLPSELIMTSRAIVISEGIGMMLYPDFNIIEYLEPYTKKLMMRRLDLSRNLKEFSKVCDDTIALFKKLPSDMQEILTKLKEDEFTVKFQHTGLEHFIRELDRSSNRLSFSLVIAALIIGSSIIFQTEVGPKLYGYPVLGLAGFILSSIFGVWLIIGILRSGKL